jgi:hypothetical protein
VGGGGRKHKNAPVYGSACCLYVNRLYRHCADILTVNITRDLEDLCNAILLV